MINARLRPFNKIARLINKVVSPKTKQPAGVMQFNTAQASQYIGIL